jgi:hypothetical protein
VQVVEEALQLLLGLRVWAFIAVNIAVDLWVFHNAKQLT